MEKEKINVFWFRRDLRLFDNTALYNSLASGKKVLPIFIFDKQILSKFSNPSNKSVSFIYGSVCKIHDELSEIGSAMHAFYNNVEDVFSHLVNEFNIDTVYFNADYEPEAIKRDELVKKFLAENSVQCSEFHDQLIHKPGTILKSDGKPYTIFTPFSKVWKQALNDKSFFNFPSEDLLSNFIKTEKKSIIELKQMGFDFDSSVVKSLHIDTDRIKNYDETRNFPFIHQGTSEVSHHLRFGTISTRRLAKMASENNLAYLNELIWREFFMHILWHFPVVVNSSFKKKYDLIQWDNNENAFELWCNGKTGYPMVDAGMRELNATGFMHGRLRMVVASFLCKNLLIDWRWGEAYFAQKLLDYELSSNNGNWQWAAGSGCDAVPYFRIFNPILQQQRFDPNFEYIQKWLPEFETLDYKNSQIIDLKDSKMRCLEVYKRGLR